jgi:hypothetical protein
VSLSLLSGGAGGVGGAGGGAEITGGGGGGVGVKLVCTVDVLALACPSVADSA